MILARAASTLAVSTVVPVGKDRRLSSVRFSRLLPLAGSVHCLRRHRPRRTVHGILLRHRRRSAPCVRSFSPCEDSIICPLPHEPCTTTMHRASIVMFISGLTDPRITTTIAAKVDENGRFSSLMFPLRETHGAVVIHAARYLLKFSTRATDYILPVAPQPARFFPAGTFTHAFARFQPFQINSLQTRG